MRAAAKDQQLTWGDIAIDEFSPACQARMEMERLFAPNEAAVVSA